MSWGEAWSEIGAKRYSVGGASARAAPRVGGRRWAESVALHLLHVLCKLEPLACGLLECPFLRGVVRSSGPELIVRTHLAISVCSRFHLLSRRCAWTSGPIRGAAREGRRDALAQLLTKRCLFPKATGAPATRVPSALRAWAWQRYRRARDWPERLGLVGE